MLKSYIKVNYILEEITIVEIITIFKQSNQIELKNYKGITLLSC